MVESAYIILRLTSDEMLKCYVKRMSNQLSLPLYKTKTLS